MFRLTLNVCIILPVVLSFTHGDMIIPNTEQMSYRLPNDTKPLTYNITIQTWIDSGNNTFVGQVIIKILVLNNTNIITLHHRQLNITQVAIIGISNSTEIFVNHWNYNKVTEFFSITTSVSLKSMELYFLDIQYNGILRAKDELGFYSSYYTNNEGETRYLALTQFQPTDARHGFPCYDEPALKANFTIRIIHAQSHMALSNMPAILTTPNEDNETITTEFEQTPLMSTYLIAFVISDFLFNDNLENVNDLPQRIFSEPNALDGTLLALNTTVEILEALENLLELHFALPKIDHIAVPHFRTGAMENWGLITYNEQSIIWRHHMSTYGAKLIVVSYIAHELAHQWFGNLVSPMWWSYLWLNEGFAIFLSFYVTDMIYTDWNITNYMLTKNKQQVFEIDASHNTHPMTHYVEKPNEIFNLFDKITYDKSSCVIRMFLHAFTENTFFKSLRYYLKESSYKVITEFDLYKSMQRAVEEDNTLPNEYNVTHIWISWTQQVGFPVVYVMRNYANNTLTISQERYLTYPMETMSPLTYWIPINFATAQNPDFSNTIADDWLPSNVRYKIIEPSEKYSWNENDWIVINKQQTGYYRVQYDRKNWNLITEELCSGDYTNIHVLSRSQLIDDSFTFARSNRLSWDVPLNIIRYLEFEHEYQPWLAATTHLNSLHRYFIGLENYELFKIFIINITDHLFNFTGIEDIDDEPLLTKYIRTEVINWACSFGSKKCRELTNLRLKELINNNRTIHQNLKDVMFCAGIRNADEFDMKHFINRMYKDHDDRGYIMFALGCASDENILKELLTYTLDKDTPAVLRTRILNTIFDNSPLGYSMAVQFLIDNVNQTAFIFYDNYEIELTILDIGKYATDDISINQAEKLFKLLEAKEHLRPYIKKANDKILENIQWAMLNRHTIDEWLSRNFG